MQPSILKIIVGAVVMSVVVVALMLITIELTIPKEIPLTNMRFQMTCEPANGKLACEIENSDSDSKN